MSTFHDFCLTCDRQLETSEDVYCSQQCRLAELCTSPSASNVSPPSTPTVSRNPKNSSSHYRRRGPSSSVSSSSSTQSNPRSGANAFVLPPAYDFSSHRHSTISNSSSSSTSSLPANQRYSSTTAVRPPSEYFSYAGNGAMLLSSSEAAKKTLSPTSSRSSITSNGDELRAYESGFDVTRDWRRRRASVYDAAWQRY